MATIRLERAARYTGPIPVSLSAVEPHKLAAWNWLQEQLTPEQVQEFEGMFRAGPPSAKPPAMPRWLEIALPLLRESEGLRLDAYPDPVSGGDPWTIGYGTTRYANNVRVRRGDRITRQQAEDLLAGDALAFGQELSSLLPWGKLNDHQRAALVSWAYNVGTGTDGVAGSTLRHRLNNGEDPATVAREELPRWNKGLAGGRIVAVPGLTNRRKRELAVFLAGTKPPPVKPAKPSPRFTPGSPFSLAVSQHITYGELCLNAEARRFVAQHQCNTAAELCSFLEKVRTQFSGAPVIITSGHRPPVVNRAVGGASSSEHLYDAPDTGAVDFYLVGVDVFKVQDWCDRNWPYSLGYGAPKGFVHLGMRPGRPRVRWDY